MYSIYRIVAKFLNLFVAECEGKILWRLFRVVFVCLTFIFMVFRSILIRDLMMNVFVYNMVHNAIFESTLFHRQFFESFQTFFVSEYIHWSKILIEISLFVVIFIYISFITLLSGSFANGMSISFGSYFIINTMLSDETPSFINRNSKNEVMQIGAWLCCVCVSLIVHWKYN